MSRLELEGARQRLKTQKMELAVQIGAKIKAIKNLLSTAAIDPIEKTDLDSVASLADEAANERQAYLDINTKIRAIDEELG